ncbi:unnamed protein product [Caenorhabditis sp. 36 PRJEB53466]|nr:unnamed protein product [Caenorhabditis sp. 36 PRJEB53466]
MKSALFLLLLALTGIENRIIVVYNNCPFTIWPAVLGPGNPEGGGFRLDAWTARNLNVDDAWKNGRIWARTGCDGNFNCETGTCLNAEQCNGRKGTPPASVAEFNLKAWGGQDFYDVSLLDGYNLPMLIDGYGCKRAGGCVTDVNTACPAALSVKSSSGNTVGCKSGCLGYKTDEECCRGAYASPDKCPMTATTKIFKDACPTAFTYAYDNATMLTCTKPSSYTVQFC